jgi:mRNA interferase MazF
MALCDGNEIIRRGDVVTVALPGAYGKLRPALVIQSDLFNAHPSVTVLPLTSKLRRLRIVRVAIKPTAENGLKKPSQIMLDKVSTIPREKIGKRLGVLDDASWRSIAPWRCSSGSCDPVAKSAPGGTFPFPLSDAANGAPRLKWGDFTRSSTTFVWKIFGLGVGQLTNILLAHATRFQP